MPVLGHEAHRIALLRGIIGRGIGRVPGHVGNLRLPGLEDIAVLAVVRPCGLRGHVNLPHPGAVFVFLAGNLGPVGIHKAYGVLPLRFVEHRFIGRITFDLFDFRIPSGEGKGIFVRFRLCRYLRHRDRVGLRAPLILGGAQLRAVLIHKPDRILLLVLPEGRGIGRLSGHRRHFRFPTGEYPDVLGAALHFGRLVRGHGPVFHLLAVDDLAPGILPGDLVAPLCLGICRLVGHVRGHVRDFRLPARELKGIFISLFPLRRVGLFDIRRSCPVQIGIRGKLVPVRVHELHNILPLRFGIDRPVGRVPGDFLQRGLPA